MMRLLSPLLNVVLLTLLLLALVKCQDEKKAAQVQASNAQVLLAGKERQVKDAEGRTTTAKQSLLLQAKEFTAIKDVQDAKIAALQQAVKQAGKHTTAAAIFTATTADKAVGAVDSIRFRTPSSVVLAKDTTHLPTYYGTLRGPGFVGSVAAGPDSVHLTSYTVTQRYTVAFTDKEVQVKPLSSSTVAADVQSFQLPPAKKPKRGLWAIGGGVVGVILLLAL